MKEGKKEVKKRGRKGELYIMMVIADIYKKHREAKKRGGKRKKMLSNDDLFA